MTELTFPTLPGIDSPAPDPDDGRLLRTVLRENAAFSLLSGTVLAAGSARLDSWLGVDAWLLIAVGAGLVVFAVSLWLGAGRDDMLAVTGRVAVAGDVGWIMGAIVTILGTGWLTTSGDLALAAVSLPVALFALGQRAGLRRLRR